MQRTFFYTPPCTHARGFSLLELVAVIVVLSVISIVVAPRMVNPDAAAVHSARDQLLSSFFSAQQLAMARAASDNPIELIVSPSSLRLEENGRPVVGADVSYPLSLPPGVTLSGATGTYAFDKLGRTQAGQLTINRGNVQAQVRIEASGYAYTP